MPRASRVGSARVRGRSRHLLGRADLVRRKRDRVEDLPLGAALGVVPLLRDIPDDGGEREVRHLERIEPRSEAIRASLPHARERSRRRPRAGDDAGGLDGFAELVPRSRPLAPAAEDEFVSVGQHLLGQAVNLIRTLQKTPFHRESSSPLGLHATVFPAVIAPLFSGLQAYPRQVHLPPQQRSCYDSRRGHDAADRRVCDPHGIELPGVGEKHAKPTADRCEQSPPPKQEADRSPPPRKTPNAMR
jgi:hypothetical protein